MKSFNTSFAIICLFTLISLSGKCQLLSENFNSGLPAWTQTPAATWSLSPMLGPSGSGCIFTENINLNSDTSIIQTGTLNVGSATNLTVTFKAALVGNNFIV